MRSERPKEGSRRFPLAGRWTRALAPVLAVSALALAAPAASPDPGGKGHASGGAPVAPGQAKKAAAVGAHPPVPHARPAAPAETQVPAAAAPVKKAKRPAAAPNRPKSSKPSGGAKAAAGSKASKPSGGAKAARGSKQSKTSAKSATARPSGGANASGGGRSPSAGRADAQPPASALPAPAAVAAAPAAAAAPAPAASPSPAASPAPAAATPSRARRTSRSDAAARRLAQARITPRRTLTALVPAATAPGGGAPAAAASTAARSADGDRAGAAAPDDEGRASPLTRTVVRVFEVIPPVVQMALAALVLLGLLLAIATAVQTARGRRLAHQRRMLLADVGVLQSALLPDLPERIGGARVSAAYRPAAGLAAGGDFYDAFELPGGRTAVIVGDVAGHGRDAVPLTALVRYNLRAYLEAGLAPRATLDIASHVLAPQLGGRQVTIVVAIFDPGTGRLTYACAGHWPPLLPGRTAERSGSPSPAAGRALMTVCSSPPIGTGIPTGRRQTTVGLAPGASACFHTDGLEAPTGDGSRLGRDDLAAELEALGPRGEARDLIARVVRRSARQPDDMAACIITALPGGAEHWSLRIEELEVDATSLRRGWAEAFLVACGVGRSHIAKALNQARATVVQSGTAVVEVRVGEELVEVRVAPPAAVNLPIAARPTGSFALAETG